MDFYDCATRAPTFEELEWDNFMYNSTCTNLQHSQHHDTKIKDLKSFTKLCNLSSPTIKKWLNDQPVYKSTVKKLERALQYCNLTKLDLQNMRRHSKKTKLSDSNTDIFEFPSLDQIQIKIQSHFVSNGTIFYMCQKDLLLPYEPIASNDLTTYNDKKAICDYWESFNLL